MGACVSVQREQHEMQISAPIPESVKQYGKQPLLEDFHQDEQVLGCQIRDETETQPEKYRGFCDRVDDLFDLPPNTFIGLDHQKSQGHQTMTQGEGSQGDKAESSEITDVVEDKQCIDSTLYQTNHHNEHDHPESSNSSLSSHGSESQHNRQAQAAQLCRLLAQVDVSIANASLTVGSLLLDDDQLSESSKLFDEVSAHLAEAHNYLNRSDEVSARLSEQSISRRNNTNQVNNTANPNEPSILDNDLVRMRDSETDHNNECGRNHVFSFSNAGLADTKMDDSTLQVFFFNLA